MHKREKETAFIPPLRITRRTIILGHISFSCLSAMCFLCGHLLFTQKSFLDQSQQGSKDSVTTIDQQQSSSKRILSLRGLCVPFISHREIKHQAELA